MTHKRNSHGSFCALNDGLPDRHGFLKNGLAIGKGSKAIHSIGKEFFPNPDADGVKDRDMRLATHFSTERHVLLFDIPCVGCVCVCVTDATRKKRPP